MLTSTSHRVLIVDDDPLALRLLGRHLTNAGYEVLTAENGREAMKVLSAHGPRLVITDWLMPEMDGLDLCRAIEANEWIAFAYVIVLSAQETDDEHIVEAFKAGADDYLAKPFRPKELLARLRAGERIISLQNEVRNRNREVHLANAQMEVANGKLAQANEELNRMATTDELTGLVNRREVLVRLSDCWDSSNRHGDSLACIAMDIDRFKNFNDAYGHAVGDFVLKETSKVMRIQARQVETVARIGGEEFLILCPRSTEAMAAVGAERIRRAIEENTIGTDGHTLRVTISSGVAERTTDMTSPDDLLRAADRALYAAKNSGRNAVALASAGAATVAPSNPVEEAERSPTVRSR